MKAEQAIRAAIKNKLVTTRPGSLPVISLILEFIDTWKCYGFKLFGVDVVDSK